MKIDINKKYKTRCGHPVRIYATDGSAAYPVHYGYHDEDGWEIANAGEDGSFIGLSEHHLDLIEILPYENFKIDEPVLVWDWDECPDDQKAKRHFAGVSDDGRPMTYNDGCTSWSALRKILWGYCEKVVE